MQDAKRDLVPKKFWLQEDQPRFKMKMKGLSSLSNSELIALLINSGTKDQSAFEIAQELLTGVGGNLTELSKQSLHSLKAIKGLGEVRSCTLLAAFELGKRRQAILPVDKITISNSAEIAKYLQVILSDLSYEVFVVIFLNRANKIKHWEKISSGGITGTVADPRLILKKAIEQEATSLILAHNHPSGNLKPSHADEEITTKIKLAASYLDIKVLDHLILSDEGYMSFADEGLI